MPLWTFIPRRRVPSIPAASTTRGGIALASARLRATPSRSSAVSRSSTRTAPSRGYGRGTSAPQHDGAAPKQEEHQGELDAVLDLQQAYGNQAVAQLLASGGHGSPPPVVPPRWQMGNRAVAQLLSAQRAPGAGPTFGNLFPDDKAKEGVTTFRLENIGGQWWEVRPPGSGRQRRPASGTYNFVVKGDTIHAHRSWGHVQLAGGERVTLAGEIHFGKPGILDTWTNDSGHTRASKTFAADDRMGVARLGLEQDKFVAVPSRGKPRAQLPVWQPGVEPIRVPRAKPKARGGAAGGGAGGGGGARGGGDGPSRTSGTNSTAATGAPGQAPPPTHWLGKRVNSDLPTKPDGSVAAPRFSTGKGIAKVGRPDVRTEDASVSHGVGRMFTPIKRGVMKTIGQPSEGNSDSYIMVDRTTGQKYLFKPTVGEQSYDFTHARGVAQGHYAERARAGAIAAGALGVATPEVRLVSINGRRGSLTTWIEPKGGGHVMTLSDFRDNHQAEFVAMKETPAFKQALGGIQALDYLINNLDRVNNTGNYMIELDEHRQFKALIPIDQELSFTHTGERAIIAKKTEFFPEQWTPALAEKVAKLKANPGEFITKIRPLVGDGAVAGVLKRLDELHSEGVRRGFIKPPGTSGPGTPGTGGSGSAHAGAGQHPTLEGGSETPVATDSAPVRTKPGSKSAVAGHGSSTAPTTPTSVPDVPVDPTSAVSLPGGPTTTTEKKRGFKKNPLKALKARDPSLFGHESSTKTVTNHGKGEHGEDITSSTERKSNVDVNFKGVEGGKDITHTTKGGHQVGAGVHGSMDWDGNTNLVASATFATRSGLSISPSVGHSDQADASDPQYVEGTGFVVTYKLSATDNYGVGGGKSIGGGTSASVNVGHSEANYQSGSRIFKTLDEATHFRDNVRKETWLSRFTPPPTSVAGALQIPMGESRGGGKASANTIGGSLSYGDGMGSLGYNRVSTSNEEVSVMRTGQNTVDVTRTYSDDLTKDPNIGAFGFSDTKGTSEEKGHAVTYTFDLSTPNGVAAFNRWVSVDGAPGAGAQNRRVKTFKQANHHDDYGMPVKFSASWKDRKWESREEDEAGTVTETFGGGQDRDTRTGRVAEFLGDKEQHASAQIEGMIKNGEESFAGRFVVSGKSGDSNLEELGKIFMGSHHDAGESSGFLLLTVQIDPLVVKELERNVPAFRKAKTRQDRMRIYTDYVRENGARMIGGQGRGGSKPLPWNLERPGDPNFPGAGGRAELDAKHQAARAQLASDHTSGKAVADSAKQELAKLKERRKAVADKKNYTDLPDELRQEQVDLVDSHIAKFEGVQSQSLSLAMRVDPNEKAPEKPVKAKVARNAKAKAPAPGADHAGADAKQTPDQREIKKLSRSIQGHEQAIATAAMRTEEANHVLGRMMVHGNVRLGEGVSSKVFTTYNTDAKDHLALARSHEAALKASAQKARELRLQWNDAKDDAGKLVALRALDAEMNDQQIRTELALDEIRAATRSAYVVTSDYGIGKDYDYYDAIKCDRNERSRAINTAMEGGVAADDV